MSRCTVARALTQSRVTEALLRGGICESGIGAGAQWHGAKFIEMAAIV
jgi:hypothetical protein